MPDTNKLGLHTIDKFGDVAAESDAVLDYFLSTNAVQQVDEGNVLLVLGRKGTGKTAIVRYFTERKNADLAAPLNLRGYPWSVHESRVDAGASEIEAYVSSWKYLIAVQIAALIYQKFDWVNDERLKRISVFLRENYGGVSPKLDDILRPATLKLSEASFQPMVLGVSLGKLEFKRSRGDLSFGLEVNALSNAIIDAVIDIATSFKIKKLSLHFDELDQGMSEVEAARNKMLAGLVVAARDVKLQTKRRSCSIMPVIYLRTDLWDGIKFSDKNKITQDMNLVLEWGDAALKELVNKRLKAKLNAETDWDQIVEPNLMRGSQTKWNHILARTFLRPRDVISFLNSALIEAKRRDKHVDQLKNEDIVASRERYSTYLKDELDDEISPHWPGWIDALKACSAIETVTFEREQFDSEYIRLRSSNNVIDSGEALRLLYRFSVLAYERRSGYGGSSWSSQYTNPEAGWDVSATRFKVHLGLKEYAKLREERR